MYKSLRIALFALPLAGGVAWAQGSGTSGSAGAPTTTSTTPPVTNDTRTPLQQKAGRVDDTTPTLPGDATKPTQVPNTVEESNTTNMPENKAAPADRTLDQKPDTVDHDTTKIENKSDRDAAKDQLGSDK